MIDPVSLEDVQTIIKLVRDAENVAEFSLKYGELEISLSRSSTESSHEPTSARQMPRPDAAGGPSSEMAPSEPTTTTPLAHAAVVHASLKAEPQGDEIVIKAPMVGTFYRAPKPGDPPFVQEGQVVGVESVLCIIEVMKLMNSIHSGVEGTVTRILVEDAQPVEYGQALIFVRKSAS